MTSALQIVLGLLFLAGIFLLTRWGAGMRMRSVARAIARELEAKGAVRPDKAVPLGYEKTDWLRIGLRDYRPQALTALLQAGVVDITPEGHYWLKDPNYFSQGQNL